MCRKNNLIFLGKAVQNFAGTLLKLWMEIDFRIFHHNNAWKRIFFINIGFKEGKCVNTAQSFAQHIEWSDEIMPILVINLCGNMQKVVGVVIEYVADFL